MTDKLFFDTDCLSSFLWINQEGILLKLYPGRIILPKQVYRDLAISPPKGAKIIGKGEAAAIALAKTYGGILASNNLKDISKYVTKYNLRHKTTGEILVDALNAEYIDEAQGNKIWSAMIVKKRKLPTATFVDYLKKR